MAGEKETKTCDLLEGLFCLKDYKKYNEWLVVTIDNHLTKC